MGPILDHFRLSQTVTGRVGKINGQGTRVQPHPGHTVRPAKSDVGVPTKMTHPCFLGKEFQDH